MKSGLFWVRVTYLKINFGPGPNAPRAGPGEILKYRSVQTSSMGGTERCGQVVSTPA
jgi:hypothetical protein